MSTSNEIAVRARPQEQALVEMAKSLPAGIVQYSSTGALMIDLSSPELRKNFNVLAPAATIMRADPNFTPSLSVVYLDPDYDTGGDFYPQDTKGSGQNKRVDTVSLTKLALDKIAQKAGIEDLGPEIRYTGDRGQNVLVTWRSRIRNQDGWTFRPLFGSQEWNEESAMALLKADPPEWATKGESAYNTWWAKNWWGRVHKSRVRMTESKARLAAYRQALTVKSKYTIEESKKPFLVAALIYTPDTTDPNIVRMLMGQGQQAQNLLFGAAPLELPPGDIDDTGEHVVGELLDEETGELLPAGDPETAEASEGETHGERPAEDVKIPQGKYANTMLSDVCRDDPTYARRYFLNANDSLGPKTAAWLIYFHGTEVDDFADVTFGDGGF